MIKDIRSVPVFRLLAGFLLGNILKTHIKVNVESMMIILVLLLMGTGLVFFLKIIRKPGQGWINGIFISSFYIVLGLLVHAVSINEKKTVKGNFNGIYIAEVKASPVRKKNSSRVEVEILLSHNKEDALITGARALIYFKNSDSLILPGISETIVFNGELRIPDPPENPGEFNYSAYLRSNGILFTCFLNPSDWTSLGKNERFSMVAFASHIREKIWRQISAVQPGNRNLDILYALALGSKDLLDKETRESFIATGTMHVLAVSGLHVGLIFMVISKLLSFLKRMPSGNILFFATVLLLLWFYALITCMSPSVVRSTIMFSFVNLGKTIRKETSVYNCVFLAAFLSLFFVPGWLYDPGFQLSYSAVLGIIFFQPGIASLLSSRFKAVRWVWEITAVSLAAQIGTISISLFYFHRFPPYFLAANLVAIPLVTLIIAGFIFQLLTMVIPCVFILVTKIVLFLVGILDLSVKTLEQLPSPGFNHIFFEHGQMWLLILMVLFTAFFIRYRHNYWLILNFICILLFLGFENARIWKRNKTEHLVVYRISRDYVVGMYAYGKGTILISTKDQEDISARIEYKCSGFHRKHSIYSHEIVSLDELDRYQGSNIQRVRLPGHQNYLCWFMDKRILLLNDPGFYINRKSYELIETDILILGGNSKIRKETISAHFKSNVIILSGSVPPFTQYNDYADASYSPDHFIFDTRSSGAWVCSTKPENQFFAWIENNLKSLGNL